MISRRWRHVICRGGNMAPSTKQDPMFHVRRVLREFKAATLSSYQSILLKSYSILNMKTTFSMCIFSNQSCWQTNRLCEAWSSKAHIRKWHRLYMFRWVPAFSTSKRTRHTSTLNYIGRHWDKTFLFSQDTQNYEWLNKNTKQK